MVGKVAEHVLFDMRRAMMAHLQRVSLGFMDKTEVGRLMSRLQGDVNSMQEFLETSVMSVGDIVLLFGIVVVLLCARLPARAADARRPCRRCSSSACSGCRRPSAASWRRTRPTRIANGALAEGINGVRTVQSLNRQRVNFDLYDEKALRQPQGASARRQIRAGDGADRRYADRHLDGDGHRRRRPDGAQPHSSMSA